jgi:hypothetical protein
VDCVVPETLCGKTPTEEESRKTAESIKQAKVLLTTLEHEVQVLGDEGVKP